MQAKPDQFSWRIEELGTQSHPKPCGYWQSIVAKEGDTVFSRSLAYSKVNNIWPCGNIQGQIYFHALLLLREIVKYMK